MSDHDLENMLKLLAAITVMLTVTIPAFYVAVVKPIIAQLKEGQVKQDAAAAVSIEQNNRYNATRGAEPVTMQSPPMGTGDGARDAAVMDLLPTASKAAVGLTAQDVATLLAAELDRRDAAKNAVPVAVVAEPPPQVTVGTP